MFVSLINDPLGRRTVIRTGSVAFLVSIFLIGCDTSCPDQANLGAAVSPPGSIAQLQVPNDVLAEVASEIHRRFRPPYQNPEQIKVVEAAEVKLSEVDRMNGVVGRWCARAEFFVRNNEGRYFDANQHFVVVRDATGLAVSHVSDWISGQNGQRAVKRLFGICVENGGLT